MIDYASAGKADVPSGTARELAERLGEVRAPEVERALDEVARPARGARRDVGGAQVHSVRLPSFVVSTEVVFGLPDERLVIRHDAGGSPAPYVAGTLLAVRRVGVAERARPRAGHAAGRPVIRVRERGVPDRPAVEAFLRDRDALRVARLGELEPALEHPALLAEEDGALAGVLTYVIPGWSARCSPCTPAGRGAARAPRSSRRCGTPPSRRAARACG